jgi:hypothetical protein
MFTRKLLGHAGSMLPESSAAAQTKRVGLVVLLLCSISFHGAAVHAQTTSKAARPVLSNDLQSEIEAYRLCGRLNLPPDFQRVKDAAAAATVALDKCSRQRFAVAGQFALDYPGTVRTKAFIDGVTTDLVQELSGWLEDVHARRVPPQPPMPPRTAR